MRAGSTGESCRDDAINPDLIYPLFVKPLHEGTGMGIKLDCIVRNEKELRERVFKLEEKTSWRIRPAAGR